MHALIMQIKNYLKTLLLFLQTLNYPHKSILKATKVKAKFFPNCISLQCLQLPYKFHEYHDNRVHKKQILNFM